MDFFEHQARARRKTVLLVVYFLAAVVLIILAVYAVIAVAVAQYANDDGGRLPADYWTPEIFLAVSAVTIFIITIGTLYKVFELSGGGETVARAVGGRPVNPDTQVLSERILLNVVEEMALASGTPVPPVYVMDQEHAINAFAAGTTPQNAVIGVTRGTIETLKRDELQGVIAHEFSHVLNGDMRLNIRLIAVLNGILLIATVGYILMRTGGTRTYFANNKKGGNPLPLVGLALYIIGYIGVFFGHLIKSAVSRQREFLADASAVQFTRYPDGIAGALKKIGGLSFGSRLKTERAEEASHMYFGNGLRAPFLQMLATHPPLDERIRRIEPKFDGKFPEVGPIKHTADELVDPRTLRMARQGKQLAHSAAVAGASAFAHDPSAAINQVGAPDLGHVRYAAALVDSLPMEVASTIRDPLGAVATIYALLVDDDEPDIRRVQLDHLTHAGDPRAVAEMQRIAPHVAQVTAESKLPLVSMTLPALKGLSPAQRKAFAADVMFLIKADKRVSLFEYAVHRLIVTRLVERLTHQRPHVVTPRTLRRLAPVVSRLLSTLAQWGSRDAAEVRRAFDAAIATLPTRGARLQLLSREQCDIGVLDEALNQLADVAPAVKKPILNACAVCIGSDGKATVEETELLRVIADALGCPMPPLVDVGVGSTPQQPSSVT